MNEQQHKSKTDSPSQGLGNPGLHHRDLTTVDILHVQAQGNRLCVGSSDVREARYHQSSQNPMRRGPKGRFPHPLYTTCTSHPPLYISRTRSAFWIFTCSFNPPSFPLWSFPFVSSPLPRFDCFSTEFSPLSPSHLFFCSLFKHTFASQAYTPPFPSIDLENRATTPKCFLLMCTLFR